MIQPKKKSISQTFHIPLYVIYSLHSPSYSLIFSGTLSLMNNNDYLVLDRTTICSDWYRLWSSFGFSEYQWTTRAAKVEEYTQVIDLISNIFHFYVYLF